MIVGLDPSLAAFGMCAVPGDFHPSDWSRIKARTVVTKPGACDAQRFLHLAKCVVSFCASIEADEVFFEDALVYRGNTKRLSKLLGVVETELYRELNITARPVNVTSARKLMLGTVPAKDFAKTVVFESLRSLGACFEDDAQSDAFVVANWGRAEAGLWAVCAA